MPGRQQAGQGEFVRDTKRFTAVSRRFQVALLKEPLVRPAGEQRRVQEQLTTMFSTDTWEKVDISLVLLCHSLHRWTWETAGMVPQQDHTNSNTQTQRCLPQCTHCMSWLLQLTQA